MNVSTVVNTPETICCVCTKEVELPAQLFATRCNHYFHHECFVSKTNKRKVCPVCRTALSCSSSNLFEELKAAQTSKAKMASSGITTRAQSKTPAASSSVSLNLETSTTQINTTNSSSDVQPNIIPTIRQPLSVQATAVEVIGQHGDQNRVVQPEMQPSPLQMGQETLLANLQQSITTAMATVLVQQTRTLAQSIEAGFQRLSVQMTPNTEPIQPTTRISPSAQPHQSFEQLFRIPNRPDSEHYPSAYTPAGSQPYRDLRPDRISQIMANWKLRFTGHASLSVDDFLYRVEALTHQTLEGNFELLARYASNLFEGSGSEWYWRFHRSVPVVRWTDLCLALRSQFQDGRTDLEIRSAIAQRKQKQNEPFDSFYEAILGLSDKLSQPLNEQALLEILRANLLSEIQHEILYVPIDNIVQLRHVVRTRERFLKFVAHPIVPVQRFQAKRHVSEVTVQTETDSKYDEEVNDTEVAAMTLSCWNCGKNGHRYQDCVSARNVFCYGCGKRDTYKPSCTRCALAPPKNEHPRAPLISARKLVSRGTNTD